MHHMLYHRNFDKNKKTCIVLHHEIERYLATKEWFRLPGDGLESQMRNIQDEIRQAKRKIKKPLIHLVEKEDV